MSRALVLAGGGVAGIAWETGVLYGIEEVDPGLAKALLGSDLILGTSAGSAVAAQVTGGRSRSELYQGQLDGAGSELQVQLDMDELILRMADAMSGSMSDGDARRAIGRLALATETVPEQARRAVIEARLAVDGDGSADWGRAPLRIVAVDAGSGEPAVFDRDSGVDLVDAVAASCAVPGVWPPVTIGERRYIDGGARSLSNVDLAAGHDLVVVLSPATPDQPGLAGRTLEDELAALGGSQVFVIAADEAARAAFGTNPLDPATRRPAAEAGRAQGRAEAARLAPLL